MTNKSRRPFGRRLSCVTDLRQQPQPLLLLQPQPQPQPQSENNRMMTSRRIQLLLHPQPIVSPSFRCSHFQNMAARGIGDNYLLNRGILGKLKEKEVLRWHSSLSAGKRPMRTTARR